MDGQEYLNKIAGDVRPAKKSRASGLMGSPLMKVAAIGVVLILVVMVVGMALGSGKGGVEKQSTELLLHIDNTSAVISTYQSQLKSSTLRSLSASLAAILSNTSRDLTNYMTEKYNYKANSVDKNIIEKATLSKDELDNVLFNAKINGVLDRIFAHKMAYEISLIKAEEASVHEIARDDALKTMLATSYDSLDNLYTQFSDFSETK
ncbi:hypothetical protein IJG90_04175 [Candidatus Saccharibacteria bacterium]|nr:hypothetical protein [Candidatus Saccharibacteria bacterium]